MTNNTSQPFSDKQLENPIQTPPQTKPETPPFVADVIPAQPITPRKSNKKLWIILGISVGILAFCCCLIGAAAIVFAVVNNAKESAPIGAVLDTYMKSMEAKDAESAYALFSPRARRQIPISKVEELLIGNNYLLFEGYQSLSPNSVNFSYGVNSNPDTPQGTLAKVTGVINYQDGFQGSFNATLEKVNDEWRIDAIFVTVPPSKIK